MKKNKKYLNKEELYIYRLIIASFINLKDEENKGGIKLCI